MARKSDPPTAVEQPGTRIEVDAQIETMQAELKALQQTRLKALYDELHHAWVDVRKIEREIAKSKA